jgi:hypothetical protein
MRNNQNDSPLQILTLLITGAAVGLILPDIDQNHLLRGLLPSNFLCHRSILTHRILVSVLLLFLVFKHKAPVNGRLRLFTIGFNLGIAVH